MKKVMISIGAVAMMVSLADVAFSAPVISVGPYSAGASNTNGDITFDSGLAPGTVVNTPTFVTTPAPINQAGPQSFVGVTFSGDAYIVINNAPGPQPSDSNGQSASPNGDLTQYMSVLAGGTETLTFSTTSKDFGLYWGSMDSYNTITFKHTGFADVVFAGNDPSLLASPLGCQTCNATNKYITFQGIVFDQIVLTSSANAFEFDNVSFAAAGNINPGVPEPSTWAMMILGFLGVGFLSYRRRNSPSSFRVA